MSEREREELQRTHVQHKEKRLKGGEEDVKKKAPARLRKRRRRLSRKRRIWRLVVMLGICALACFTAVVVVRNHYRMYPGVVERDSVRAVERGSNSLSVRWNESRNTDEYKVYLREHIEGTADPLEGEDSELSKLARENEIKIDASWSEYKTDKPEIEINELEEGKSYSFMVRPINAKQEGHLTKARNFKTRKTQAIKVTQSITKLTCSKPFKIDAQAETDLVFESDNPEVAEVSGSGEIVIKGAGTAEIAVHAKENAEFVTEDTAVDLLVLDTKPVKSGGAKAHNIYHLDSDNCDVVKEITGAGGASVPQSFGYTGDKYIVAYGMGNPNRIITFDVEGDGKEVSVPKVSMGHPNGFAYADENKTCYSVKGWTSRAVTYDPESGKYGSMNFTYGCSGIGYDRKEKLLYTSSRTVMAAYSISDGYSVVNTTGVVSHSGSLATQDIGAHAGIMIRCLSPNGNIHGINYIDLYDMRNGTYLGTFSCDLSEVESAIVNKDGFLEILANNSGRTDYIWRTNINIETLAEGIEYE